MSEREIGGGNQPFEITLSLNVLNHLGLNLYSNVPNVLAETVANSWDADAERVDVDLYPEEGKITIRDDGHGMTEDDVNNRYLHVGYRRREDENRPSVTPKHGRPVIGRKGIGKLSLFAIANTVDVYTKKDDEENAFRMEVQEIKDAIRAAEENSESGDDQNSGRYHPEVLTDFPADLDDQESGTKIVLSELKKNIYQAEEPLRKRLARRFSVAGPKYDFIVSVNGDEITVADRDYFHKLQFIWKYGDQPEYGDEDVTYGNLCPNLDADPIERDNETEADRTLEGWIGTVPEPGDLRVNYGTDESDDLNKISLIVRGKMAKEDLLEDYHQSRNYINYVVGEIRADFIDQDDLPDIQTTDRDSIYEESDRYSDLIDFLEDELNYIRDKWDDLRSEQGTDEAREIEPINTWYETLSPDNRDRAKTLFGKINTITTDSTEERRNFFKFGVLAFERLRYKENLRKIEQISPGDLEAVSDIFLELDDLEATLYYQIVKQRIEIIEKLEEAVDDDAKEDVLQDHLFDHLWLLDPAWERATDSQFMEKRITTTFKDEIDAELSDEERRGRIDIKYRLTSGRHVIIELKRASRIVSSYELAEQASKYRDTLKKILRDRGRGDEAVEVVSVVGRDLQDWEGDETRKESEEMLAAKDVRVIKYDELLDNAYRAYEAFMNEQEKVGMVSRIIEQLDTGDFE